MHPRRPLDPPTQPVGRCTHYTALQRTLHALLPLAPLSRSLSLSLSLFGANRTGDLISSLRAEWTSNRFAHPKGRPTAVEPLSRRTGTSTSEPPYIRRRDASTLRHLDPPNHPLSPRLHWPILTPAISPPSPRDPPPLVPCASRGAGPENPIPCPLSPPTACASANTHRRALETISLQFDKPAKCRQEA